MAQRGLLAPAPRPVLSPLARALSLVGARWRGGRAVEGARLESVYAGNRIAGSNPAPSAISASPCGFRTTGANIAGDAGCPPKPWRRRAALHFVHLIENLSQPNQRHVGETSDL